MCTSRGHWFVQKRSFDVWQASVFPRGRSINCAVLEMYERVEWNLSRFEDPCWRKKFLMDPLIGWNTIGSRGWHLQRDPMKLKNWKLRSTRVYLFFSLWNIGRLKRKNDKNNVQNNRKMSLYYERCYSDDVFFFSFEKHLKFNKEDSR